MRRWFRAWRRQRARGHAAPPSREPIPAFPRATMEALRLLRDAHAPPDAVASAIERNPGLVVRLLRIVNSAAFGLRREVTRTSHALTLLGRTKVESILIACAVKDQLGTTVARAPLPDHWEQAAWRAALARGLAARLHPETQSECFVGGMLLDIGLPVLAAEFPGPYRELLSAWSVDPDVDVVALEREAVGMSHTDVGRAMAQQWELPAFLQGMIEDHHQCPPPPSCPPAVALVAGLPPAADASDLVRATAPFGLDATWVTATYATARAEAASLAEQLT